MIDNAAFERVRECFNKGQRFVLTTHVNPDGDGLGSEAALAKFLRNKNKEVHIYNCSPVPLNYDFLDPQNKFVYYNHKLHYETLLTGIDTN